MPPKIIKTDAEWQAELTPEQYHIMRAKGTEAPFSGAYVDAHEAGQYACAGCGNQLFTSDAKFNSGTGWPSFDQAIPGSVVMHTDESYGMRRTEVTCATCGAHLGHVFDDGPVATTGQRFCINSACLRLEPNDKK